MIRQWVSDFKTDFHTDDHFIIRRNELQTSLTLVPPPMPPSSHHRSHDMHRRLRVLLTHENFHHKLRLDSQTACPRLIESISPIQVLHPTFIADASRAQCILQPIQLLRIRNRRHARFEKVIKYLRFLSDRLMRTARYEFPPVHPPAVSSNYAYQFHSAYPENTRPIHQTASPILVRYPP